MTRRQLWLIFSSVVTILLLVGVDAGLACDCHESGPPCEAFWRAPVVFTGHVESIRTVKPPGKTESYHLVRFSVTMPFRGTTANEIEISSSFDNCSFNFKI